MTDNLDMLCVFYVLPPLPLIQYSFLKHIGHTTFLFFYFSMAVFLVTVISYDWHLEYALCVLYLSPLPLTL